jgi:hypothetical protein
MQQNYITLITVQRHTVFHVHTLLTVYVPYLIIKHLIIVQTKQFFAQFFLLLLEIAFVIARLRMASPIWSISFKIKVTVALAMKNIKVIRG